MNDGFRNCLPPDESLMVMVRGRGSVYGNPPTIPMSTPADGEVYISINRLSIHCDGAGGGGDGGGGGGDGGAAPDAGLSGVIHCTGVGQWASMRTPTASEPITGLEAGRIANRVQGDPLHDLRRPNGAGTGTFSWADAIPILAPTATMTNDANHDGIYDRYQLAFLWEVGITLDTSTCRTGLRIRSTGRRPGASIPASGADRSHVGPVFNRFVQPQYTGGRNNSNFGDEVVTIHDAPLEVNGLELPMTPDTDGRRRSQVVTACSGNCDDVSDAASIPQSIEVQLIAEPPADAGTPEDAGRRPDAGADAGDGGIPPLPGPDGGRDGGADGG